MTTPCGSAIAERVGDCRPMFLATRKALLQDDVSNPVRTRRGRPCAACRMAGLMARVTRACLKHRADSHMLIPPRVARSFQLPWSEPNIVAVFTTICRGAVCAKQAGATLGQFHVTVYVTNPRSAHVATEAMLEIPIVSRPIFLRPHRQSPKNQTTSFE